MRQCLELLPVCHNYTKWARNKPRRCRRQAKRGELFCAAHSGLTEKAKQP